MSVRLPLIRSILFGILGLCLGLSACSQTQEGSPQEESFMRLADSVRALKLGHGGFFLGATLTADQLAQGRANLATESYPGTMTFTSGDLMVVADAESHLVLALYQRIENAGQDAMKNMVGSLMGRFGEPTTMAHDKLIYWAYGPAGKIGSEAYQEAKISGAIDILATVKFSSFLELDPRTTENPEETGVIYYIITSDPLLSRYVTRS